MLWPSQAARSYLCSKHMQFPFLVTRTTHLHTGASKHLHVTLLARKESSSDSTTKHALTAASRTRFATNGIDENFADIGPIISAAFWPEFQVVA